MLQFIDFEVPAGSYGCELYITDAGKSIQHSVYRGETMSMNSVATNIIVKSLVPNAFHSQPTYNDISNAPTSLISAEHFGDIQIATGDVSRPINSEACPPRMSSGQNGHLQFVFGFSDDDGYTTSYFSSKLPLFDDSSKVVPRSRLLTRQLSDSTQCWPQRSREWSLHDFQLLSKHLMEIGLRAKGVMDVFNG